MKRIIFLLLSMTLMSVILLGCQLDGSNTTGAEKKNLNQHTSGNQKLEIDGKIASVSISKSKGGNATVFDDEVSIEALERIISSAVKRDGIVDMVKPDSFMSISYENENKQSFHLWIGKDKEGEKAAIMKTDDTHTLYVISEKMTKTFIDLLK